MRPDGPGVDIVNISSFLVIYFLFCLAMKICLFYYKLSFTGKIEREREREKEREKEREREGIERKYILSQKSFCMTLYINSLTPKKFYFI